MADSREQSIKLPTAGSQKLQQSQAHVDEVVGIMRVNVEKVLEQDQKLSELDNHADVLQQGASQFEQQATKLKKKLWWTTLLTIGLFLINVILLLIGYVSRIKAKPANTQPYDAEQRTVPSHGSISDPTLNEVNCVICLDDKKVYACNPCGHMALCSACYILNSNRDAEDQLKHCPFCRQNIQSFIRIYD